MMIVTIDLPYPPSVNNLFITTRSGKRVTSPRARAYRKAVGECVLVQGVPRHRLKGSLYAEVGVLEPLTARRRDLDNLFKAVLDGLVHAGVMSDDSEIDFLTIQRNRTLSGDCAGRLLVTIGERPCLETLDTSTSSSRPRSSRPGPASSSQLTRAGKRVSRTWRSYRPPDRFA